ncbi:MAG: xanthine dehydrogenase family protein molybdopterin-binding subunit [Acidimicrobiia bacterium]
MATTSVMGGAVRRREDPALITGRGKYVDDLQPTGLLHVAFNRSPYAHARIKSVDTTAASKMPGVVAIFTHEDVAHLGPLVAQVPIGKLRPLLSDGEIKHAGEAIAMVIAENRYQAQDAADAIEIDCDVLPAVIDLKDAKSDATKVHEDLDSNVLHTWTYHGYWEALGLEDQTPQVDEAMDRDDAVVVSIEMNNQRLIPVAIEPRSVMADYDRGYDRFTVHSSTQVPHALAGAIATMFEIPPSDVRVIAPEVGGGFGAKLNVYNDEILVAFASKQLGRPVKWTETRREAGGATIHGRGWLGTATIVGTKDGEFLGYKLEAIADMGAYSQNFTVAIPLLGLWIASGQYKMPVSWTVDCVVTHTMTTDAYRGAGRPEAIYYLERIIDAYAREIGMDPLEVRRKNFWKKDDFPATMGCGFALDSGDYDAAVDRLIEISGYQDLLKMRDEARTEGRHVGIGIGSYVEVCGFGPAVLAEIGFSWAEYGIPSAFNGTGMVRVNPDGTVTVLIGTGPTGQGHETTWAQIVGSELGIPVDQIRVRHGDTNDVPMGIGTFGSRSMAVDGAATFNAATRLKEKAARIAAHLLEASAEDVVFGDGSAHVAGSPEKSVEWGAIAKAAYQAHTLPDGVESGLEEHAVFSPGNATWPFGTHLAVVEVDETTGDVKILKYVAVDDCGNIVNPMIVNGQVHGGITQGIGQALFEDAVYDESGNLLTGSLLDYPLPTASDLPSFELSHTITPTDVNPMGVKGIGEAGTIGSAHTIVNAVVDALSPLGVKHIDMPLRPKRVWAAIQEASN